MHGLHRKIGARQLSVETLRRDAEEVESHSAAYCDLTDALLRERLADWRKVVRREPELPREAKLEAMAAIREAAFRTLGMRPYPVQLMGAMAIGAGCLAEMATGEGKTLTVSLAAVMAGWLGRPCHVVTVNDYLAERDAEELRPLYEYCGLTSGAVIAEMPEPLRREGYTADIAYASSKELTADFLRDRLCLGDLQEPARRAIRSLWQPDSSTASGVVMRGMHSAFVDEADSVLIDEAVTPLIISGSQGGRGSDEAFRIAWAAAQALEKGVDYRVDERRHEVELLSSGREKLTVLTARLPGLWAAAGRRRELITQALTAREFFHPGRQYVVMEGKIVIVDEFTGRLMPLRKWRHGLHQVIEVKEGVEVSSLDETLARLSFQNFFRLFRRLGGMTGTATEAAAEFWNIYHLPVVQIPPNRPCQRVQQPDAVFLTPEEKWKAVLDEVIRVHRLGQPVLVGTRRVSDSEALAERVTAAGLHCTVLNAVRHHEEAEIVAGAGEYGRITIATNMAGRGTDIRLGNGVKPLGGLHVIATERHETSRVDRQLYGRAGRQGDPGSAQAFVSIEDEVLTRFSPAPARAALKTALQGKLPGAQRLASALFARAQSTAQRMAFLQRRAVLEADRWLADALAFTGPNRHR